MLNLLCRVVTMREHLIPDLTWPVSLNSQQLSLDLVEVTVRGICVEGKASDSLRAIERLRELRVPVAGGGTTRLFNEPHKRYSTSPLVAQVNQSGSRVRGALVTPVFSGRLIAKEGRLLAHQHNGSQECVNITLVLNLNVPRFLASQSYSTGTVRSRPLPRFSSNRTMSLAGHRGFKSDKYEVAFGKDGNVLLGPDQLYNYASSKCSVRHFFDLLNSVLGSITRWLQNCDHLRNNKVVSSPRLFLSRVEWHAEFATNDPRRELNRLAPTLLRQGQSGNIFRRRLSGQVRMFGPYSQAVQITLSKGIKMTAYAKASRRIRFEMKYWRGGLQGVIGRRTRPTPRDLAEKLHKLRQHARSALQVIFDELFRARRPESDGPSRDDLVARVARLSDSYCDSEEVVRSLRDSGRVIVENGAPMRRTINNLRSHGILRFIRHSVYTVTDEYEFALQQLMAQPGAAFEQEEGNKN